ncbi:MAG: hypothetical protein A2068_09135 [Ignavibacteria bacterium GWB2_35_6b]|nr:MAG: hypothetical protein A2068_09135 [Ignavibacteria bacterium GWB2_35_6b]
MKYFFIVLFLSFKIIYSQQIGDPDFNPQINNPAYQKNSGSIIFIDEFHNNFHTKDGRYKPFAELLEKDGYIVKSVNQKFTKEVLSSIKILVISNPLNEINDTNWTLPTPSAFSKEETIEVEKWVSGGGSLFLIADHMPFPGAAGELAAKFGFLLNNGFASDTTNPHGQDLFSRNKKTLQSNKLTNGRSVSEFVDSIYTFTGSAFQIPQDAESILTFNENFISLMPDTAWNFTNETPKISVENWSQGAVKEHGKGKVVMCGEAAMFSAQLAGNNNIKMGMNTPKAKNNYKLLLNIIHWLDGIL